jgi:hypothetical protein
VDRVVKERETDRLGADTARAVQNGVRPRSELLLDQPIERGGLAPHRPLPIGKDEMVALGQFVVERPYRVDHGRIIAGVSRFGAMGDGAARIPASGPRTRLFTVTLTARHPPPAIQFQHSRVAD